jgi:sec-independent protein translocase protein TatC
VKIAQRRRRRADGGRMSVVEHLEELRFRLIVSIVAVVAGAIVAYTFYEPLLDFLLHPLDSAGRVGEVQVVDEEGLDVFVGGIATAFVLRLKVSAFAGLIFALPVVLFQLWRFITPGLQPREKRYSIPFVLSGLGLFALGGYVAFSILPVGIQFLLSFVPPAEPLIQLPEYLSFVMFTVLGFGLTFQFPLVLVFLGGAGIVSSAALRKRRRMAILLAFIASAIATPSGDPLSQTAMAVPLYILYEASIAIIRFVMKR